MRFRVRGYVNRLKIIPRMVGNDFAGNIIGFWLTPSSEYFPDSLKKSADQQKDGLILENSVDHSASKIIDKETLFTCSDELLFDLIKSSLIDKKPFLWCFDFDDEKNVVSELKEVGN